MADYLIKYAFTYGEISPTLFGRSDVEQYDLALAIAQNWQVDYRGGLTTRAGMEFCDFVMHDDKETKLQDFNFAPDLSNNYLLLFGDGYLRFLQDGAYVLEAEKNVVALAGASVGIPAHGYSTGDWIKADLPGMENSAGRTFRIIVADANNFVLYTLPDGNIWSPEGVYAGGGTVSRIYTVASPYAASDLDLLRMEQRRDVLRLTHHAYPVKNLNRLAHDNWTITDETFGTTVANAVQNVSGATSGAGTAGMIFCVTAVFEDGSESLQSIPSVATNIVNYTTTAGSFTMVWSYLPGAVKYKVYRSQIISIAANVHRGMEMGYIGSTNGTMFTDNNIIPDFTKTPPQGNKPFAAGAIDEITITNGGTGYPVATTSVTVTDPNGTGFSGYAIVVAGVVTGVKITERGQGYTNPTITFTGSPGTGATGTITSQPLTGTYPAISSVFQQRQVYAGSDSKPLTLWASQPGRLSDFDYSEITIDSDSYEFEVDSAEIAPLRHMVALRGGLILMSQTGVWLLNGGNAGVVTPSNAVADPQTYTGVSKVPPVKVGTDLLYVEGKGFTVRLLSYNDYSHVYSGEDRSLLSNHLFAQGKRITSWGYAENPYKIVFAVRSDGTLLNFTIVKDEKVFGWTRSTTYGKFVDVRVVQEDETDRAYFTTQRLIAGRYTKFIERYADRDFIDVEHAFCVDCGLSLPQTFPAATITSAATSGTDIGIVASVAVFSAGDVGKWLRMGGGRGKVVSFTDSTHVGVTWVKPIDNVMLENPEEVPLPAASGEWTLDPEVDEIGGLWHLEGMEVAILGDGFVIPSKVVEDGKITLPAPISVAHIGLPYKAIAKTLPPVVQQTVIEARRKRIMAVACRVNETVGLAVGPTLDELFDMDRRQMETMGSPIQFVSEIKHTLLNVIFEDDSQVYIVQDNPLPASLLSVVYSLEVGDDPG